MTRLESLVSAVEGHIAAGLNTKSGPCLLWSFATNTKGYGIVRCDRSNQLVHRVAYKRFVGELSDHLRACHHCDIHSCFNPGHLFSGTDAENSADMVAKNRHHGPIHPMSGERHHMTTLRLSQVNRIRKLRSAGKSSRELGRQFGVTHVTILNIANRKTWR